MSKEKKRPVMSIGEQIETAHRFAELAELIVLSDLSEGAEERAALLYRDAARLLRRARIRNMSDVQKEALKNQGRGWKEAARGLEQLGETMKESAAKDASQPLEEVRRRILEYSRLDADREELVTLPNALDLLATLYDIVGGDSTDLSWT